MCWSRWNLSKRAKKVDLMRHSRPLPVLVAPFGVAGFVGLFGFLHANVGIVGVVGRPGVGAEG